MAPRAAVRTQIVVQCGFKHAGDPASCNADVGCSWAPAAGVCVPSQQQGEELLLLGGRTPYSQALTAYSAECRRATTQNDCVSKKAGQVSGAGSTDGSGSGDGAGRGSGNGSGNGGSNRPPQGSAGSNSPPQGGEAAGVRGLGAVWLAALAGAAGVLEMALLV